MSLHHFYDLATGLLNGRSYSGPADLLGANTPAGCGSIEADSADWLSQKVLNGALVDHQPPAPPADPLLSWEWSAEARRWVSTPTLAGVKAAKWAAIKAARDAAISAPKATSFGLFDAKPADQDNLNKVIALTALAIAHGQADEARYTLATNERVTLTLAQLQLAALEIGAQTQAVYETASTIRAQIESAESAEALEGIAWPTS